MNSLRIAGIDVPVVVKRWNKKSHNIEVKYGFIIIHSYFSGFCNEIKEFLKKNIPFIEHQLNSSKKLFIPTINNNTYSIIGINIPIIFNFTPQKPFKVYFRDGVIQVFSPELPLTPENQFLLFEKNGWIIEQYYHYYPEKLPTFDAPFNWLECPIKLFYQPVNFLSIYLENKSLIILSPFLEINNKISSLINNNKKNILQVLNYNFTADGINLINNLLIYKNYSIPFKLKQYRSPRYTAQVKDGVLEIRTYTGKFNDNLLAAIHQNTPLILKTIKLWSQEMTNGQLNNDVTKIQLLGSEYHIIYVEDVKFHYKIDHTVRTLTISAPQKFMQSQNKLLKSALRAYADKFLKQLLAGKAFECGLKYNRCVVKDHVSKWGSCSTKRNINLNWHLILLRTSAIEYVIIHELMHLHEMNHSNRFWSWVSKYCPNYKAEINYINQHGWVIGQFKS